MKCHHDVRAQDPTTLFDLRTGEAIKRSKFVHERYTEGLFSRRVNVLRDLAFRGEMRGLPQLVVWADVPAADQLVVRPE
jgi:hypothetical protein